MTDRLLLEAVTVAAHGVRTAACLDPTPQAKYSTIKVSPACQRQVVCTKAQEWLVETKPVYDVAMFFPTYLLSAEPHQTRCARMKTAGLILLVERQVPASYLYPDAPDLSPFQLVILDKSYPVSDELVTRLAEFVRNGGSVLASSRQKQVASPAGSVCWMRFRSPFAWG